jgi:hypothetical protein
MEPSLPPNYISPISSSEKKFVDSIPEVKSSSDLWQADDPEQQRVDIQETNKKFWSQNDIKHVSDFENGYRQGIHLACGDHLNDNLLNVCIDIYTEILKQTYRTNNKSLVSVKYLLDVLKTISQNITYIIEQDKISLINQQMLASMHGFIIGVTNHKTKARENERINNRAIE